MKKMNVQLFPKPIPKFTMLWVLACLFCCNVMFPGTALAQDDPMTQEEFNQHIEILPSAVKNLPPIVNYDLSDTQIESLVQIADDRQEAITGLQLSDIYQRLDDWVEENLNSADQQSYEEAKNTASSNSKI